MNRLILIALVAFLGITPAFAQGISLSAAQRQMLDSLPPAQRQQALDAIAQLEQQQQQAQSGSGEEGVEEPGQDVEPVIGGPAEFTRPGPHARERSRLVVNFLPVPELSPEELEALMSDPALRQLVGSQLFILDDAGVLVLQGLEMIPLLGLNEEDIEARLEAEPYLGAFDIQVRILGQEPIGVEALLPFGYEILQPDADAPEGGEFEPSTAGPVPPDYVLGPGDTVRVQLFGNVNGIYEFEVSRDGILNLPNIGPVNVAGMRFRSLREDLNERVRELLIGTQVSVTMGALRSIRVFVLGDVNRPGSYVVSGMATISAALYASGGISEVGSLRNVQLKRGGETVAQLDFYDLLIEG
ncbi:MAG: polysaccharide biosynthesis/export family protein, partial [Pseudomonadota bacterium]